MRTRADLGVPVFAWITGQDFNIGDSLLRRPYLSALAEVGPVDVWVRSASPGFLTGLGVERAAVVRRSFTAWFFAAASSAIRRRTIIALNAGEVRPAASRAVLVGLIVVLGLLARLRGGSMVWLGATITPHGGLTRVPLVAAARLCRLAAWREAGPVESVAPLDVCGDWGFVTGQPVEGWAGDRTTVAVLLRGDRPSPSEAWLTWLRTGAARMGARVVVAVQVENDHERATEVAQALGAELVNWPAGIDHATQERRVRELYRGCSVVVSDRLHALIVGATEGAVPLGWVESSRGKIAAHFGCVGMSFAGSHEGEPPSSYEPLSTELIDSMRPTLALAVGEVRASFATIRDELHSLREDVRKGSVR